MFHVITSDTESDVGRDDLVGDDVISDHGLEGEKPGGPVIVGRNGNALVRDGKGLVVIDFGNTLPAEVKTGSQAVLNPD